MRACSTAPRSPSTSGRTAPARRAVRAAHPHALRDGARDDESAASTRGPARTRCTSTAASRRLAYGGRPSAEEEGARIAEALAPGITVLLMDNHGVLVVGESVADASAPALLPRARLRGAGAGAVDRPARSSACPMTSCAGPPPSRRTTTAPSRSCSPRSSAGSTARTPATSASGRAPMPQERKTLTGRDYTSAEVFELERERIFSADVVLRGPRGGAG